MDAKAEKRLLEDVRAIRRLLESLAKQAGPDQGKNVAAELRRALADDKPAGYGGFEVPPRQ